MASAPASVQELDFNPKHKVFPSPRDWRDQFFYHLLIDRFNDGKKNTPAYDPDSVKLGRDRAEGGKFQGGTLQGIVDRLDYIQNLGCTAIWISPPFKNRQDDDGSYHGYGIQDFLQIDPRFGTLADMQRLVREAHKRGMYVIVDIVINHTGDVWRYADGQGQHYKSDGQWEFGQWHKISKGKNPTRDDAVWPIELQSPDAFKRRGPIGNITNCSQDEAINGDFFSLKELNLDNPIVLDALIKSFKYWIAVADVDGYRIDTVRNVEPHAAAIFCNAIHEYATRIGKDNFFIFGEIVGDDDLLHKYVGRNTPVEGTDEWYPLFDACLDFPLYAVLDEVIKGASCSALRQRYDYFRKYFRDVGEAALYYLTFVDNHDQSHRPWRRFLHGQEDPRLTVLAIGYLLTNLGIPCIYYGTEQGFDGGGDSDVFIRETMFGGKWGAFDTTGLQFFNDKHPIYQAIAQIAAVRASESTLRYGRQYFRDVSSDGKKFSTPDDKCMLPFSRILDTEELLVVLNLNQSPMQEYIAVDAQLTSPGMKMTDLLNRQTVLPVEKMPDDTAAVRVKLDGRTMAIFKAI
jgi:glycosidase